MGHSTNYENTLIEVSSDCRRMTGEVPAKAGSVAAVQHQLISQAPYGLTSDDVIWQTEVLRGRAEDTEEARAAFFSVGRPCLRASPLVKTYGWGIHSDTNGRVALIAKEGPEYRKLLGDSSTQCLPGMRSKRR